MTKLKKSAEVTFSGVSDGIRLGGMPRRSFLQYAGVGIAAISMGATSCEKEDQIEGIDLGSGDVGLLNYLYLLEQLEAAFYVQTTQSFYAGATDNEIDLINEIRDHEIAHREFFKNALGGVAIPAIEFDFSSITFTDRSRVLEAAKVFEDLGVSAYNGVGALMNDEKYLSVITKVVSVEARHAALIRDLISEGSFASSEIIDVNGLDKSLSPEEVLAIAGTYIKTIINVEDLPTA